MYIALLRWLVAGALMGSPSAFAPRVGHSPRSVGVFGLYDGLLEKMEEKRALGSAETASPRGSKKAAASPAAASPKALKKARVARQRAGSATPAGVVATDTERAEQAVRVEMVRRGDKQVTMIRGLEVDLAARKELLKGLKSALGGGGVLDVASGTLELQGAHGERILAYLLKQGFASAKQAGKAK